MKDKENNLIWIDLEFSGLNFKKDKILEIAIIITDSDLNILKIGPNIAIKTSKKILKNMDKWNLKHHKKSGLIEKCLKSKISIKKAEQEILKFVKNWSLEEKSPLCGNSIGQDKKMLFQNMPELEKFFHYRVIDVSSIKELSIRWRADIKKFKKESKHIALDDIKESIAELKYYKKHIFDIKN